MRRAAALALGMAIGSIGAAAQSSHDAEPGAPTLPAASLPALEKHPVVALTFDDLPGAGVLPVHETRTAIIKRLADELKANGLTGTYGFVNGNKIGTDADEELALHSWIAAGMNIGSHTWSHMSLTGNSAEAFDEDIAKNEATLSAYAQGRDWHWFRYPFLWEGDTLEKRHAVRAYLLEHGYCVAEVTLDFEDCAWNDAYARCTAKADEASIAWLEQSYLATAKDYITLGREEEQIALKHEIPNILLLHETAFTTRMLPKLLELLRGMGFTLASLEDVEKDHLGHTLDPDAALKYGGTLPDQYMDSRHLQYPAVPPKPFAKMKSLCQ